MRSSETSSRKPLWTSIPVAWLLASAILLTTIGLACVALWRVYHPSCGAAAPLKWGATKFDNCSAYKSAAIPLFSYPPPRDGHSMPYLPGMRAP